MNRLLPLAMVAVGALGCADFEMTRRTSEKIIAQTLISDEQEFQLGLQVHEQLKKEETRFLENPTVELYVEAIARKLIAQANKERQIDWKWFVIDDPKTVNAFATPGGRIYIYTGLILAAENEAELVGVVGHEIGHVVGRHSARQLVAANGLQVVSNMALGKEAGELAKFTAGLAGKGAQLAYGRDMELESDQYGARYASGAGYDPRALATFFEKLKAKNGDTGILTFLSTHPANSERIAKLQELIVTENLNGKELGVDAIKPIQAALGKK